MVTKQAKLAKEITLLANFQFFWQDFILRVKARVAALISQRFLSYFLV